jgi:hypothetical protein
VENNEPLTRDAVWEGEYLVQSKLPDRPVDAPKTTLEVYNKKPGEKATLLSTDTIEGAYSIVHFDKQKNRIVLASANSNSFRKYIATIIIYDVAQQKIVSSYQLPFKAHLYTAG